VTHVLQPLLIFCAVSTVFHIYSELQEHGNLQWFTISNLQTQ